MKYYEIAKLANVTCDTIQLWIKKAEEAGLIMCSLLSDYMLYYDTFSAIDYDFIDVIEIVKCGNILLGIYIENVYYGDPIVIDDFLEHLPHPLVISLKIKSDSPPFKEENKIILDKIIKRYIIEHKIKYSTAYNHIYKILSFQIGEDIKKLAKKSKCKPIDYIYQNQNLVYYIISQTISNGLDFFTSRLAHIERTTKGEQNAK